MKKTCFCRKLLSFVLKSSVWFIYLMIPEVWEGTTVDKKNRKRETKQTVNLYRKIFF